MRSSLLSPLLSGLLLSSTTCLSQTGSLPVDVGTFGQEVARTHTSKEGLPSDDILDISVSGSGQIMAQTDKGLAVHEKGRWIHRSGQISRVTKLAGLPEGTTIRQVARDVTGKRYVATDGGLFEQVDGQLVRMTILDGLGRQWAADDVRGVGIDSAGQLWVATRAGVGCREEGGWRFYEGKDGLPYNDFTCVAAGPGGAMWFGTHLGAIRFDQGQWSYRQGKRWLPDDDVRAIAVDRSGTAWVATGKGVGTIGRVPMTLAEKAEFYESELEKYIQRTPFGYVSEVSLKRPGDKSEIIYHDSDNDGLWTGMYGAAECFAYGATKSPAAKRRARKAFKALQFLQQVTQTGEHRPPPGYVARTIRSTELPDPNVGRLEQDKRTRERGDALWKVYEPRWPKSGDGKWYWKTDTSSDELDGHYFFYSLYFDLVAETESDRQEVREVVRSLTDHLVKHNFQLVDHDGTVTRWANYAPESLNHDFQWYVERGLNSLSMLSYLAVAEHVTGNPEYGVVAAKLREQHAYHANLMVPKIHLGFGSGNQSDDEMGFMCFYSLIRHTQDPALRERYLLAFHNYYMLEAPELNPFFNFAYAAFGLDAELSNQWGRYRLRPLSDWLEDSLATLKGFPLDRLNWGHQNSHRLDLISLRPGQGADIYIPDHQRGRGYRVNGKVLPVEERFFNHWNTDPWRLDYRGNGNELASGTVFLLPYYMGLHHGFLK